MLSKHLDPKREGLHFRYYNYYVIHTYTPSGAFQNVFTEVGSYKSGN